MTRSADIVQLNSWVEAKGKRLRVTERAKRITDRQTIEFVKRYSESERVSAGSDAQIGEIYYLYFKANGDTQRVFVIALCKLQKLEVPAETETPRKQLIQAIYGAEPALTEASEGDKDSKGGKRITAAMRSYEEKAGLRKRTETEEPEDDVSVPRSSKRFVVALFEKARPEERKILTRLISRAFGRETVERLVA